MIRRSGWSAYSSSVTMTSGPEPSAVDDGPAELADVGRLARRVVRGLVRTARAEEGVSLGGLLRAHLAGEIDDLSVVDEAWQAYEHVNVQAGVDAWLAEPGREHQLLNEMDGLAEDADVVFVLTTNRADLLEPALAARPGRVDQAVELPLPDRAGRQALFELYRGRLDVDPSRLAGVLDRTDGVTASFLKELLRRAAVRAADDTPDDGPLHVGAGDLDAALDELLDTRNAMTRVVLGGARPS